MDGPDEQPGDLDALDLLADLLRVERDFVRGRAELHDLVLKAFEAAQADSALH